MKKILILLMAGGLFIGCNSGNSTEMQTASVIPVPEKTATAVVVADEADDVWLESLITDTPQEGRELAMKMARKTIGAIQSDPAAKKRVRADYAEDAEALILAAQVVATEFQTVAAANNYWRK